MKRRFSHGNQAAGLLSHLGFYLEANAKLQGNLADLDVSQKLGTPPVVSFQFPFKAYPKRIPCFGG